MFLQKNILQFTKLNRGKLWKYSQSYLFPFIKSVLIGVYIFIKDFPVFIIFINPF